MPVASRLKPGNAVVLDRVAVPKTKPAPEERWWFPLGSITRIGEGVFRWHCVGEDPPTGKPFIFSGRLDVYDNVGHLLDEDCDEGIVDEDPMEAWYEKLPTFPYAHFFCDKAMDVEDSPVMGPWFCIHAHYGPTRGYVEMECSLDR